MALLAAVFLVTWHAWPAYVGLLLLLGLGGWRRLEDRPIRGVTCGVLGATALTHAVFFGAGRYALIAYPWIAALAFAEAALHARVERPQPTPQARSPGARAF
jgi:hypothetical protein